MLGKIEVMVDDDFESFHSTNRKNQTISKLNSFETSGLCEGLTATDLEERLSLT